ncbi:MAG: type II toxin-antitoxin system VapB family antitoxin [Pseudomonadota bacterium]
MDKASGRARAVHVLAAEPPLRAKMSALAASVWIALYGCIDNAIHTSQEKTMTLQIRDQRARELAKKLAAKRKVTMTEAVVQALEGEWRREAEQEPLAARLKRIADDLAAQAGPNRRTMTKDEVDAMWGHS